jgi:uncharacterized protein (TIGR02678 family)
MTIANPQAEVEQRAAARHLLQHPMVCAEQEPDMFRLIRRHEHELDRWFTQRLGYRLQLNTDTARLHKSAYVPHNRPLRTPNGRAFHQLEYTMLALVLGCVVAGPAVISLRHLVDAVRSAAAESGIALANDAVERRALVNAVLWMVAAGIASELHEHVSAYAEDAESDAVIRVRPERVTMTTSAALLGAHDATSILARAERRTVTRQWMRLRLVEDPVLYRDDVEEVEWAELRRRLGEERVVLDEMFGLHLEVRAEGIAAIDPDGVLADQPFPTTGTVGHCALLLIERLSARPADAPAWCSWPDVVAEVTALAHRYRKPWRQELVDAPERLAGRVVDLLVDLRLAERDSDRAVRLLPAATRFTVEETVAAARHAQESLL